MSKEKEENKLPIKTDFDERLKYFKNNPEKLKHYINVMKVRYNSTKIKKDEKNTE